MAAVAKPVAPVQQVGKASSSNLVSNTTMPPRGGGGGKRPMSSMKAGK